MNQKEPDACSSSSFFFNQLQIKTLIHSHQWEYDTDNNFKEVA